MLCAYTTVRYPRRYNIISTSNYRFERKCPCKYPPNNLYQHPSFKKWNDRWSEGCHHALLLLHRKTYVWIYFAVITGTYRYEANNAGVYAWPKDLLLCWYAYIQCRWQRNLARISSRMMSHVRRLQKKKQIIFIRLDFFCPMKLFLVCVAYGPGKKTSDYFTVSCCEWRHDLVRAAPTAWVFWRTQ